MLDKFFTSVINKKEIYSLMIQFVKDYIQLNPLETQGAMFKPGAKVVTIRFSRYKSIELMELGKSIMLTLRDGDDISHYEYDYNNYYRFKPVSGFTMNVVRELPWDRYLSFWKEVLSNYFNLGILPDGTLQLKVNKLLAFKQQVDSQIRDI